MYGAAVTEPTGATGAEPVLAGQLGDFTVAGILGSGGSGVVLDARWGHREVALKVLHPSLVPTERERMQFFEEARRLQEISHPCVVKVLASGELPDGRPYLAMEKLAGPTLAARLADGAIPMAQALAVFEHLAGAVQALHDRGLVHRDLKPENIVLVGETRAVLLDFGIAKPMSAPASTTTQDGGVRGTPAYMAPERFFGSPATVATDVYELAVTLYAMLAGRLPWADCADPEVRLNPAPLGAIVPDAVDVELRRALSTRAQNRPGSARELASTVLAAAGMASTPTSARTTTQVPLDLAAPKPAWFETGRGAAGSGSGENKGTTPLAWAPTARAEQVAPVSAKKRPWWPFAAAGVAVAAAVIGWIAIKGDDGKDASTAAGAMAKPGASVAVPVPPTSVENDPWKNSMSVNPTPETGAELSAFVPTVPRPTADLRREMRAAIGMLPAATRTILGATIVEIREDPDLGKILGMVAKRPEVQLMIGATDKCEIGASEIEWAVLGFPGVGMGRESDILVRGRWTKERFQACLVALAGADAKVEVDGPTQLVHIVGARTKFWFGAAGDVMYVSTREKVTPADLAPTLTRTEGPEGAAGDLLAKLDANASMILVVEQDDKDKLDFSTEIPAGVDIAAWARLEAGVRGDVYGRFRNVADAKKAEAYFLTVFADVTKQGGDLLGTFVVTRAEVDVKLEAFITPLTVGLAATQLTSGEPLE
jgi:predicted Ser/Thr protein kinase